MNDDKSAAYQTRNRILKLLSDDEVSSVSTAESAPRLSEGDEYLDLEQIDQGVRRADGVAVPMGRVLPRAAVRASTWSDILATLAKPSV